MIGVMRNKFGPIVIGLVIGTIAIVFVMEGWYFRSLKTGPGAAFAGSVNGEPVSIAEFKRDLNRRIEMFQSMMGGNKLTDEQMKQFRIYESVFNDIAARKVMLQEAKRVGLVPADEAVRDRIFDIPQLKKDGRFDKAHYRQMLEANGYTPASFEALIRDELTVEQWRRYTGVFPLVSSAEVQKEFQLDSAKRTLKYVVFELETARKGLQFDDATIQATLKDEKKMALVKARYDAQKDGFYKGKTLEQSQKDIVKDLLASEKMAEVQAGLDAKAQALVAALKAKSEAKAVEIAKTAGAKIQTSGSLSRRAFFLAGVGEAKEIMADAFLPQSPIDVRKGGSAKLYTSPNGIAVAWVVDGQDASGAEVNEADAQKIAARLIEQKNQDVFQAFLNHLMTKAKIQKNETFLNGEGA